MARNFADLFEHAVDAMPDRVALLEGDRRLTFAQVDARANRLAAHLRATGIGPGTHVGFHLHNGVETVETLLACFKIRAVPININYRYGVEELRYVYDNADLEALVYHACYAPAVREAAAEAASLRHRIVVPHNISDAEQALDDVRYDDALAAGSPERDFPARSDDDLFMMYTGGTTGLPKGVMWRQEDMWRVLGGGIDFYTGVPVADEYEQSRVGAQGQQSTWFVLPPLIHAAAMMPSFAALWSGNAVLLEPRFDPNRVWQCVVRHRPQVMVITGDAMARPLLDAYRAAPVDASGLLAIGSGAALLSQPVKNALLELLPSVVITDSIGSSETGFGGIGFAQKDDDPGRGPRVQTGRGSIVVDDGGRPVGPGEEGWLAKSGSVPLGYYKDPVKTDKLFKTVDGVRIVVTDDRARIERDGSVTLLGRGNMVVNTGGEKVFVEEVEGVVKACDGVYDAVVVGVPHERWGSQVAAVVSVAGSIDLAALTGHVRKHLAGYKVPKRIWLADTIVRSPSGKPDYRWAKDYTARRAPDYRAE
ncbi:acyl-CoA synthetase (AMP-forming)/AMP-acid ligase II [Nocardia tenerifensis]|uniref:Acyl-CoA synthetase (AMP-forming)/AMP-acid ligase II n=1 Tax=Nocardia tenerifensis TaxID=228006 RepID=A0A318K9J1_9NOCA|nr:acyl-CoA synthetase [Nocardia tenerifensis]PXX70746.1 acyl-CoA synthetase (AMP-forming)/AMP-acid ligase II [Nocardia tenerifensis]